MRLILCLALFFWSAAHVGAQEILTWDSRLDSIAPVRLVDSSIHLVDVGAPDRIANPDYHPRYRSVATPALWHATLNIGVTITGTLAQARSDLSAAVASRSPAREALMGVDLREEVTEARKSIDGQGQLQQRIQVLEAVVLRLARLIEAQQESIEQIERE